MENTETNVTTDENIPTEQHQHINQDFTAKFKLKDRLKILFGKSIKVTVVTVVKDKPDVVSSVMTIKF